MFPESSGESVWQCRPHRIETFGDRCGTPGEREHEAVPDNADHLAREHRVWRRLHALVAHHLGHARNLVVEHRRQRLRGDIARTEAGASGENEDVGCCRALAYGGAYLLDVVGHALPGHDIGRKQREPGHDDVAAAVISVDAATAVTHGDLRGAPAPLVSVTHSRTIRS